MIVLSKWIVAGIVGTSAFLVADRPRLFASGSWTASAEARVGRPMTPMSYAGVARRTTRRSVAVGAAGAAAYGASGYYAPGCTQVVDAYGAVYYRCP
jgi:hypothetical protein